MLRPTVIEDGVKRRERDYFWGKHKGIRATMLVAAKIKNLTINKIYAIIKKKKGKGNYGGI